MTNNQAQITDKSIAGLINKFKNIHFRGSSNLELDIYLLVAVMSSGILKGKQKLGVTFNFDKLGGIDFTKFSKLTMCSA